MDHQTEQSSGVDSSPTQVDSSPSSGSSHGSRRHLISRPFSTASNQSHRSHSSKRHSPYTASAPAFSIHSIGSTAQDTPSRWPLSPHHARAKRYVNAKNLPINSRYGRLEDHPQWGIAQVMPRVPRHFQRPSNTRRSPSSSRIRTVTGGRNSVGAFVDPEYQMLNPRYGHPSDEPVWGLAAVLPHRIYLDDDAEQNYNEPPVDHVDEYEHNYPHWLKRRSNGWWHRSSNNPVVFPEVKGETEPAPELSEKHLGPIPERPSSKSIAQKDASASEDQAKSELPYHRYNFWSTARYYCRSVFAELLGTMIGLLIGLCTTISASTSSGMTGDYGTCAVGFGLGFMIAIYIGGGGSGAHYNPVISINLAVWRGFPWSRCFIYILAQLVGSILAGLITLILYREALTISTATALSDVIYPVPQPWTSTCTRFFSEFVGAAIIVCSVFALGDDSNVPPGAGMHAFIIGLLVIAVTLAFGYNTSGVFNPVRDLGPRIASWMTGGGTQVFTTDGYFWLYGSCAADLLGGLFGGLVYDVLIYEGGESPINFTPRRWKEKGNKILRRPSADEEAPATSSTLNEKVASQYFASHHGNDIKIEDVDLERGDVAKRYGMHEYAIGARPPRVVSSNRSSALSDYGVPM